MINLQVSIQIKLFSVSFYSITSVEALMSKSVVPFYIQCEMFKKVYWVFKS